MAETLRVRVNDRWYTVEAVDVDAEPAVVLVDGERVEVTLDEPLIRAEAPAAPAAVEQPAAVAPAPAPTPAPAPRTHGGRARLLVADAPASCCRSRLAWATRSPPATISACSRR